ncbi:MAG: hypothetical protein AB3N64_05045 [Puniceicoccaceae bacterium]
MNLQTIKDYLLFRRFLMPVFLQVLFWAGIGGTLYGAWWLYTHDNWAWIMALLFGIPVTRLVFESLILRYQTYLHVRKISQQLDEKK